MNKKNLILGGILLALVTFTWVWSGPVESRKQSRLEEVNFLSSISLENADSISIEKGELKTVLEKINGRWKVGGAKGFDVKKEAIDELSFAFDKAAKERLELAGSNPEKKLEFGTDEGIKVVIVSGQDTKEFTVGNATANFDGSYISFQDTEKTWRVATDLSSVLSRGEWRDDNIFSFFKERADKVRFQYPRRQFTVEKKDNKWQGVSPSRFTVKDEKVEAILEILENLKTAQFPEQKFEGTGLERHGIIVQVTGEALDHILMVGDCTKDKLCYAKRGDSDNIYMITREQRDALNKQSRDLR